MCCVEAITFPWVNSKMYNNDTQTKAMMQHLAACCTNDVQYSAVHSSTLLTLQLTLAVNI